MIVVTYKRFNPTSPTMEIVNSRKRKKPGYAPNHQSSIGDKARLGAAPPVGGTADPANDPDKGFYENLPFHGMQNPPNKPISVIAPFTQDNTLNINRPITTLIPTTMKNLQLSSVNNNDNNRTIQRHQSFHGFQSNQYSMQIQQPFSTRFNFSNPYLNATETVTAQNLIWPNWPHFKNQQSYTQQIRSNQQPPSLRFVQTRNNIQPLSNFNAFPSSNPFSIAANRVSGRRESDIRRTASGINLTQKQTNPKENVDLNKTVPLIETNQNNDSDDGKKFGSLEIKKHRCYSPTFYSVRCKKHAKKRPVVYALPKKLFTKTGTITENGDSGKTEIFEQLTDSIQIFEQNLDNSDNNIPIPAPRCKKHRKSEKVYANVAKDLNNSTLDNSSSSNDSTDNVDSNQISITLAQVHSPKDQRSQSQNVSQTDNNKPKLVSVSPKVNIIQNLDNGKIESLKAMKNSPILKVSPNFIKPKTESPKGALSLQIQAKLKNSTDNLSQVDDNSKENLPLIPQMPLLSQNKWNPNTINANPQNAFYTLTTPHYKHINAGLSSQYSATIPHQKHTTKLIPRALFNEQLPKSKSFSTKSKHKKHFQIPIQKCHSFKFQTAESYFQPIKNIHEEDLMKNGHIANYPSPNNNCRTSRGDKPKQKTRGPLVVRRSNNYHEQFQENVHNSVQLQYPQPIIGRSLHHNIGQQQPPSSNGVVYADLDMPKSSNKKNLHDITINSTQNTKQKSKTKTEYATLAFNDIGQEIDV